MHYREFPPAPPFVVKPTGTVQVFGIRFAPGGALPFLSVPPGELTDRIVPLDEASRGLERELCRLLEADSAWQEKIALVEGLLLRQLMGFAHARSRRSTRTGR